MEAGIGSAGVGEDLAVVTTVSCATQAEEARAVRAFLAGAAIAARTARAGISAFQFTEPTLPVRRTAAVEVKAHPPALSTLF